MKDQKAMGEKALDASTRLAVDRTYLSYERTLMSWVRTAVSLITFGFTIYKFFQLELAKVAAGSDRRMGPTQFALLMIVIGLVSLLMAVLENRRDVGTLRAEYPWISRRPLARVLAAMISILGLLALLMVLLRR